MQPLRRWTEGLRQSVYEFLLMIVPIRYQLDLPAVNQTGKEEIDAGLNPKSAQLESNVRKRCTHRLNADISIHAESRRKEAGDRLPEGGNGRSRPRYARDKEQRHGETHEEQDAVLAPPDE